MKLDVNVGEMGIRGENLITCKLPVIHAIIMMKIILSSVITSQGSMNTPRIRIVLFAAALFLASSVNSSFCFAQQQASPVLAAPVQTQATPQLYPKRSLSGNRTLNTELLPFQFIRLDSDWADVSSGNEFVYSNTIRNASADTVTIYFFRTQQLPPGWSTSVCWGATCYSPEDSTEVYTIPPGDSASLSLDLTPSLSDYPDSSTVWLRAGVV